MRGLIYPYLPVIVIGSLATRCSTVQCGEGTVLQNGVCIGVQLDVVSPSDNNRIDGTIADALGMDANSHDVLDVSASDVPLLDVGPIEGVLVLRPAERAQLAPGSLLCKRLELIRPDGSSLTLPPDSVRPRVSYSVNGIVERSDSQYCGENYLAWIASEIGTTRITVEVDGVNGPISASFEVDVLDCNPRWRLGGNPRPAYGVGARLTSNYEFDGMYNANNERCVVPPPPSAIMVGESDNLSVVAPVALPGGGQALRAVGVGTANLRKRLRLPSRDILSPSELVTVRNDGTLQTVVRVEPLATTPAGALLSASSGYFGTTYELNQGTCVQYQLVGNFDANGVLYQGAITPSTWRVLSGGLTVLSPDQICANALGEGTFEDCAPNGQCVSAHMLTRETIDNASLSLTVREAQPISSIGGLGYTFCMHIDAKLIQQSGAMIDVTTSNILDYRDDSFVQPGMMDTTIRFANSQFGGYERNVGGFCLQPAMPPLNGSATVRIGGSYGRINSRIMVQLAR